MSSTSLNKDPCSYSEKLARSVGPGMYMLNAPSNDMDECGRDIPDDPSVRWQAFGPNFCSAGKSVDVGSELRGLNYKSTKCATDMFDPSKPLPTNIQQGMCQATGTQGVRKCSAPQESTRISNPPTTLKDTGINRWEWLCYDPQSNAIANFANLVSNRILVKDNFVPCIPTPTEQTNEIASKRGDPSESLQNWKPEHFTSELSGGASDVSIGVQTYRSEAWGTAIGN